MEIDSELNNFLYQFEFISQKSNSVDDSFYEVLNDFKLKYTKFIPFLYPSYSDMHENKLITTINGINRNELCLNGSEFLEILWKSYNIYLFNFKLTLEEDSHSVFKEVGIGDVISPLNSLIDELILHIIQNNAIKEIIIYLNLITTSYADSIILDIKLIFLYITCLERSNFESRFFDIILSKIYLIQKKFLTVLSSQNSSQKQKDGKIKFLEENLVNLFKEILRKVGKCKEGLYLDLNEFKISDNLTQILIEFSEKKVKRKIYRDNELSQLNNTIVYTEYLFEVLNFLNTLSDNSLNANLSIQNIVEFHDEIIEELLLFVKRNIFFYADYFKSQLFYLNESELLLDDDIAFSIYKHMNKQSLSYFYICMLIKETSNTYFPQILNKLHLLDTYLPFISIMIKNGETSFFLAFETLFKLVSLFNKKEITSLEDFKYYSYIDLFIECVENIGLPYKEKKKHFIVKNIDSCLKIISDTQKKVLFSICLKRKTKNDGEKAFIIYILKNLINEEFSSSQNKCEIELFDNIFLVDVILSIMNNESVPNNFDDLTQYLNFAYFLFNIDYKNFYPIYRIFTSDFKGKFKKTLDKLFNEISKYIDSSNENEDITSRILINKAIIARNLIIDIERLIK